MRTDDYEAFTELMQDLCAAYDKPFSDRLVRVFWEDLRAVDLKTARNLATLWRKMPNSKFPKPADLRPKISEESRRAPTEKTIQEQLCEFAARKFHDAKGLRLDLITHQQYGAPWTYLYKRHQWFDEKRKENRDEYAICVGVKIPAARDGSRPGYTIMVEDMQLASAA